jgi:hypothetical protein
MPYFNESQLEQAIIALLQEQEYDYVKGEDIVRDLDEVVLHEDLAQYLRNRYKNDGITEQEVENAIRVITQPQRLSANPSEVNPKSELARSKPAP